MSVSECFENLLNKKNSRKQKVPKYVKKLYTKKSKISKKILKTKCKDKVKKLRMELEIIEGKLKVKKEEKIKKEESYVIEEIKSNPKAFFRYAKRKRVIKSNIGPFLIDGKEVR